MDHDEAAAVDVVDASVFSTLQAGGVPEKLSRTKKYAFKISAIKDSCPWYDRAYAVWSRRLGSSLSAQYAIACRLNDTELSTMSNYRGKWNLFLSFCEQDGHQPLPATPETVASYVGFLAHRGTIHADSTGQYFAAISKAHVHCGYTAPVVRDVHGLISSSLKGLSKLQKQVFSEDQPLYLPAPYVSTILDATCELAPAVRAAAAALETSDTKQGWRLLTDAQRQTCEHYRDGLLLVFNFCDFGRADTQARMSANDVGVDAHGYVVFRLRFVKGRGGKKTNLTFQWPPSAVPELVNTLQLFQGLRAALCAPKSGLFWRLPWQRHKWDTSHYDLLIRACLKRHGFSAPEGFIYSSRSLRAGPVSAAKAIGVDLDTIRYIGGWSPDSSVPERSYLDRTCPPTPAAWRFFGWHIPRQPPLLQHHDTV